MPSRFTTALLCLILGVANVLLNLSFVKDLRSVLETRDPPLSHYSTYHNGPGHTIPTDISTGFIEDDVPERLPLLNARPTVLMSIEESTRYSIDQPESFDEWLWTATAGDGGNVRLGPNGRLFTTAYTHELHCLRSIRKLLAEDDVPKGRELAHAEHCLSFLRQHALCAADATLEPGDAFSRNFTASRVTVERQCKDVEAFYDTMWKYWQNWLGSSFREQKITAA